MKTELERVAPMDIERRSFEIIASELQHPVDARLAPIILRVIHATADFDFADTLCFSNDALEKGLAAIRDGATIITDTTMAQAGINKRLLAKHGGSARCFVADEDVAEAARRNGTTRSVEAMKKAATLPGKKIFAIRNAPTALVQLYDMMQEGRVQPELIIGVPVGFVNVVQAKELILQTDAPYIVARGRKGGSNVAAAICNALIYLLGRA